AALIGPLAEELGGIAITCDVTHMVALQGALAELKAQAGPVHTLLWNVGPGVWGNIDEIGIDDMEFAWRTNALGLFVALQEVLSDMRIAGEGNVLVTGATASRRGMPFTTAFAAGKAAQRSLCQSLARQLWPEGIHGARVGIDGRIDLPTTRADRPDKPDEVFVSPAAVAQTALHLCRQDRTAWSFELEIRPHLERW
ncbi:MAG TPA: SDR family NAD(P)-dependent oxidoreductase, partial [Deltaproteobacteria bacterium]|nr:SDR family NAD(P)-dependent oxidoreductase [Deltaproteobacteria bacterium]